MLWIRIDPDMQLIRSVVIRQPDFQWQYQLRHERDVTAQAEAAEALGASFPSAATRKALADMVESEKCFYKIRCLSTHCLAAVANAQASSTFEVSNCPIFGWNSFLLFWFFVGLRIVTLLSFFHFSGQT